MDIKGAGRSRGRFFRRSNTLDPLLANVYRVFGQMGWGKEDVDNADFFDLVDIMESGKEKGPVPLDQLNTDNMDFDAMKKELQGSGKWTNS